MRFLASPVLAACLAVTFFAAPLAARADDASRRAKAEEMLRLTKTDALMQEQMAGLEARINGMAKQEAGNKTLTADQTKLTADYTKQVSDVTDAELNWEKMRPAMIDSYAAAFTEPELDAIVAFYKSPAGQAVVARTPDLAQKTMTMVQDRIKAVQPKLVEVTRVYSEKMNATAPAPAAPPAPVKAPAAPAKAPPAPAKK